MAGSLNSACSAPEANGLTTSEIQVLRSVAEGLTAIAIARRRAVSVRTIHKHLENAYRKIGCHDRVSAVLFAWRSGLLPTSLTDEAVAPEASGPATGPGAAARAAASLPDSLSASSTAARTISPTRAPSASSDPVTVTLTG